MIKIYARSALPSNFLMVAYIRYKTKEPAAREVCFIILLLPGENNTFIVFFCECDNGMEGGKAVKGLGGKGGVNGVKVCGLLH